MEPMNERETKRKLSIRDILLLQIIVVIYTLSGVAGKFASGYGFLSPGFILCYGIEILILGVYAVLWQQIIKRFDLSIAYCNRAFAVCWSFLWGVLLFGEHVKPLNIVGIVIVLAGILLVNQDAE